MKAEDKLTPTASQTVGPFFHLGCTEKYSVENLITGNTQGERARIIFRVFDGGWNAVDDAMIEIWQANARGKYSHPDDPQAKDIDPSFQGYGRAATDKNGACSFQTIRPGPVSGRDGKFQASHINVSVFARGVLKRLATRIYFAGDPALAEDPVLALVPENRRGTLLAQQSSFGEWVFDIHLSGPNETVFFDV